MGRSLYVQYGCGWNAPSGWLNYDASPTLRVERFPIVGKRFSSILKKNPSPFPINVKYGDIVRGLPLPDGSCKGVYCSHVLEHLSFEECQRAVRNTKRLLSSGGIFRLVVPDLAFYIQKYIADETVEAAFQFMEGTSLGEIKRHRGLKSYLMGNLGNSKHRWMWDYVSLEKELILCGFSTVHRAQYNDSKDTRFIQVERPERWENALGIECIA